MAKEQRGGVRENVRAAIKRSGKTQRQIAAALAVTPEALSRWLSGSRGLTTDRVQQIAAACGFSLEEVIGAPPEEPRHAYAVFKELVLLGMPAAVAYDLSTRNGRPLSAEERDWLNGLSGRLQAAFQRGEGSPEVVGLFGEEEGAGG